MNRGGDQRFRRGSRCSRRAPFATYRGPRPGIAYTPNRSHLVNQAVGESRPPTAELSQIPFVTLFSCYSWPLPSPHRGGRVVPRLHGAIERRHGPVIAILVTGFVFGFVHFTRPEGTLILMP